MSLFIIVFGISLVLALIAIAWMAYCMFVREKHKSEFFQKDLVDLRRRNYILDQTEESEPEKKEGISVGVFVLPSKHKQKEEDYTKRPDYPETPVRTLHPSTDKLMDMLSEGADLHNSDGIYEVDSPKTRQSPV